MRDDFALLNEPRRPWLDPEELKTKFLELSSQVHPDRFHNASPEAKETANRRYAELNAAYQRLREPRDRLLHLLELERGAKPEAVQQPPAELIDVGFRIGPLFHQVDAFLAESTQVRSPMLRVRQFQEAQEWSRRLAALKAQLAEQRDRLQTEVSTLNAAWETAEATPADRLAMLPLARVEEIYKLLSYLNRWISQIEERLIQLFV